VIDWFSSGRYRNVEGNDLTNCRRERLEWVEDEGSYEYDYMNTNTKISLLQDSICMSTKRPNENNADPFG
jgi:hypothetical protein